MKYHPFAEPWPLLQGAKFDELVADIKAHGLLNPILTWQDMILDGRNRERACIIAGVQPRYEKSTARNDIEALAISTSLNKHRRHMSDDALAFVAEKLANIKQGTNEKYVAKSKHEISSETSSPENQPISREDAAKAVGVSVQSVIRARVVRTHAPELEAEVMAKRKSLTAAAEEARARGRAKEQAKKARLANSSTPKPRPLAPAGLKPMTRQDVDPEFIGTEAVFIAEYGHVWTQTSEQRSTERFSAWAIAMGHIARKLKEQQTPKVTPRVIDWLRNPHRADIERMRAALLDLEKAVDTARVLLDRAEASLAARSKPNGVPKQAEAVR
jgi:ParB-like chromosome segregation protein Spo0J